MSDSSNKSDEYWRKKLSPEQYHVLREKGTEPAFTGEYTNTKEKGKYVCGGCGYYRGKLAIEKKVSA